MLEWDASRLQKKLRVADGDRYIVKCGVGYRLLE